MKRGPGWPSMGGRQWQQRVIDAQAVGDRWSVTGTASDDRLGDEWLASTDPTAYVGFRHHTVPRFLLHRWADTKDQVRTYHRVEGRRRVENIRDLAVTDFYTVIDHDGQKNSTVESLMGVVESEAKKHIDNLLNPFSPPVDLGMNAVAALVQFAAFQATRTMRFRRELELQAEWYAKTMAAGHATDDELKALTVTPHQNETVILAAEASRSLVPFFMCRPLAIMTVGAPLLYLCDEPVVLNSAAGEFHLPDCYLSDQEIEARVQQQVRKIKHKRRGRKQLPSRTVHFSSTRPTGHGIADEILLPISPGTALLWGPMEAEPWAGPVERVALDPAEGHRFATMANDAMSAQALDWIVSRTADAEFAERHFTPPGPLMKVCDDEGAAALSMNSVPHRLRPQRLWTPEEQIAR